MIDVVLLCLDDAKAEETVAIDIAGKSSLADHMVVTSGRSNRHVSAVADQLVKAFRALGFKYVTLDLEGFRSGSLNAVIPLESLQRPSALKV